MGTGWFHMREIKAMVSKYRLITLLTFIAKYGLITDQVALVAVCSTYYVLKPPKRAPGMLTFL